MDLCIMCVCVCVCAKILNMEKKGIDKTYLKEGGWEGQLEGWGRMVR